MLRRWAMIDVSQEKPQRRQLSQFAGSPIYFFDTNHLLQIVRARTERSETALNAAVATALQATLSSRDVKIGGDGGFHLVFTNRTSGLAADRTQAICTAIADALAVARLSPEEADRFCRPISVNDLGSALGLAHGRGSKANRTANPGRPASEGEEFTHELAALFEDRLLSSADDNEK